MTTFDFSGYVHCPKGWRIMRRDSELWLDHLASNRVYIVKSPLRGEFELYYTDMTINRDEQFIARSDSMYDILRKAGVLMPQPNMTKAVQRRLGERK